MADDWYIRINNVDRGPLSAETLKQLALEGKITPKTPLKKGPSGSWALASGLKGLFPMAADAGAPHISPSGPTPSQRRSCRRCHYRWRSRHRRHAALAESL